MKEMVAQLPKSWLDEAPTPEILVEPKQARDSFSYSAKKKLLGKPLNRHFLMHQRLYKKYALGILSSDCISSSAYGSEQILIALIPAFGLASFQLLIPMTVVILIILVLLTLSYNNVIASYTSSGGAYIVARENLGTFWSVVAAVALILDYIVTIAIQSAAGVVAIASFFPTLGSYVPVLTILVIVVLSYGNLRGVKEAGKSFALPTYLFVASMFIVFGIGLYKIVTHSLAPVSTHASGMMTLGSHAGLLSIASIFILLRAFANGGSSLTGLEAISNGVSLFQHPEGRNARITMNVMSGLLGSLVFGVSWFAMRLHSVPYESGTPSVISVIAKQILGNGTFGHIWFAFTQLSTMLILIAGANTVYNAFPILAANIAEDGFLPRQFAKRGHKLVYSNGILTCSGFAIALVIFTGGSVNRLVALYALGVFTAFSITGYGMFVHARKFKGRLWRSKAVVSLGASVTSVLVVLIFATVKFTEGAWLIVVVGPALVFFMYRLSKQYQREQQVLELDDTKSRATLISKHDAAILIDSVDIATLGALRYARSLHPRNLEAVHFVIDDRRAELIKEKWNKSKALADVPLKLIDCPDRRIPQAVTEYARRVTQDESVDFTLILPRRSYSVILGKVLHDQTAEQIARPISRIPRVVATIIPFDVNALLDQKESEKSEKKNAQVEVSKIPEFSPEIVKEPIFHQLNEHHIPHHFESNLTAIGGIIWRKRAHVVGQITAITYSSVSKSPSLQVEIWDHTGGVQLQFWGRRNLAGMNVGSVLKAEGMVGEQDGRLTILNPTYELVAE
jgi:amino acid transporter